MDFDMKNMVIFAIFGLLSSSVLFSQIKQDSSKKETFEIYFGGHYAENNDNAVKLSLGIRYSFIGIELGGSITRNEAMPSYNDYSIPHSSYTLKTYRLSQNFIALTGYFDLNQVFSIKGRLGVMFQTDSTLATSTTTGWNYSYSSETNYDIVAGIGLSIYPYKWIAISFDYDYSLGISASFGYKFKI
jgi:hypothetical protein